MFSANHSSIFETANITTDIYKTNSHKTSQNVPDSQDPMSSGSAFWELILAALAASSCIEISMLFAL